MRWQYWEQVEELSTVGSYPSRGHGGARRPAQLRLSPETEDAYRGLVASTRLPAGSLIVQRLSDLSGATESWFVMERGTQDWTFLKLSSTGYIVPGGGDLCARCHAEGIADSLFGLPTDLEPPPTASTD